MKWFLQWCSEDSWFGILKSFYENDFKVGKREIMNGICQRNLQGLKIYAEFFPYMRRKTSFVSKPDLKSTFMVADIAA